MSKVFVFIVFVLFTAYSQAGSFYIDNNDGKDSNKGSKSSPWKSLSKVNSYSFNPGDTIFFKRGSVWNGTLYIKRDGTSDAPIIYTAYGSGSLPEINGRLSSQYGIYMDGRDNIVIQNLNIINAKHSAVRIKRGNNIIIDSCNILVISRAGIFIEESENCLIVNNFINTPSDEINNQTDGIYAQRNSDIVYSDNRIIIQNEHRTQHSDGMQFYLENNATIKNNYVEQKNFKTGKAQGIYCSQNKGTFRIFNNISVGMHTTSGLIKFKNSSTSGKVELIGNTVYGGKAGLVQTNDPYIIFKNNIVVTTGKNAVVNFEKTISSKSNVNHNIYNRKGSNAKLIIYKGSAYKMSDWKSAGYDKNSLDDDPSFTDASEGNFGLQSGSPALNRGADMDSPYNIDREGTARPFGSRTDIGAFEMELLPKALDNNNKSNETALSETSIPDVFSIAQNYPNPLNPSTVINFTLPENALVTLKVYDITGSEVATLVNDFKEPGYHQVAFNAAELASGTYIYILRAKDFVQTRKMILLK